MDDNNQASILVRMSEELKASLAEEAKAKSVSLNALIVSKLDGRPAEPNEGAMVQHSRAKEALELIFKAEFADEPLTYQSLLNALGLNPKGTQMMGGVCDLLDAAAALAGVPPIALWRVRSVKGEHNPKAFAPNHAFRKELMAQARHHHFTGEDYEAISRALDQLRGKGNRAAWRFVREQKPDFEAQFAAPESA